MAEYIKSVWKINLRDLKQPLLYVNFKDKRIYLPTELCHDCALPDNFTSDSRKMRDLNEYKIQNPTDRFERIAEVLTRITNQKEFAEYDIKLSS